MLHPTRVLPCSVSWALGLSNIWCYKDTLRHTSLQHKLANQLVWSVSKEFLYGSLLINLYLQAYLFTLTLTMWYVDHGDIPCFKRACLDFFFVWSSAVVISIYWQTLKILKALNHYSKGESLASQVSSNIGSLWMTRL